MIKMSDVIADIEFLPPFSKVAQKALTIIREEDYELKELSDLIKYDPSLTANILKVANSAAFAKIKEVSDLQTAMNLLGSKQLSSIIMVSAAKKYFERHMDGYEHYQGEIWEHSLTVAVASQELIKYEPEVDKNILFTAALLHDIGKLIMSQYVAEEFEKIISLIRDEGVDFITAERRIIGFTHPVVGSAILKKWNFSKTITDVAKFNKTPGKVDNPYVNIVALADYVATLLGKTSQKDGLSYKGYDFLLSKYDIKSIELTQLISTCIDNIRNLVDNLKL